MFIRLSATLVSVVALAWVVTAAPGAVEARGNSQCNTGSIQCCNQVTDSSSSLVSELGGLLGLDLSGVTGSVGVSCSPAAGTGADCSQQPTCCTGDSFSGLIVIGCSPITVNL